ncbi:MAG: PmoA family protein [Planctomycetia bacterium]|nr:PmoA family protein [Planctomycetia bacterium]
MTARLSCFLALWALGGALAAADAPQVSFKASDGELEIEVGDQPFATYVYRDEKIPRPYLAHVKAPGGIQATRNHPPVEGQDATDHADFHPGIWLAFGDLSGADNWRLKARVEHVRFVEEPKGVAGRGAFAVRNRYLAADGKTAACEETCRISVLVRPAGYLLVWDSTFQSDTGDFYFGDQEEMGLGFRVATPIAVAGGGRILNADGDKNEKEGRGKQAAWCDYRGTIDGRIVGATLMPDPKNPLRSYYHVRDYGLMVANPFGRNALTGGKVSRVTVRKGERYRLRFGVLVCSSSGHEAVDVKKAHEDFVREIEHKRE